MLALPWNKWKRHDRRIWPHCQNVVSLDTQPEGLHENRCTDVVFMSSGSLLNGVFMVVKVCSEPPCGLVYFWNVAFLYPSILHATNPCKSCYCLHICRWASLFLSTVFSIYFEIWDGIHPWRTAVWPRSAHWSFFLCFIFFVYILFGPITVETGFVNGAAFLTRLLKHVLCFLPFYPTI